MSLSLSLNFLGQSYRSEWNGRRSTAKFLPTPQQVLLPLPPSLLTLPPSPPKFGTSSSRRWRSLMRSKRPMKMISQNRKVKPLTQVLTPLHLSKKMLASGGLMAWAVVHTGCETTGMVVCGTLIVGKGCTMSPIGELYLFGYRLRFVLFHSVPFGSSFFLCARSSWSRFTISKGSVLLCSILCYFAERCWLYITSPCGRLGALNQVMWMYIV